MASAIDKTKDTVVIRAKHKDEEGKTRVEKVEVNTHKAETAKYIERKLIDMGVHRPERHPVDGLGGVKKPPPKKGHGGRFTWEGPDPDVDNQLEPVEVLDEGDPNYVDEEAEAAVETEEEARERLKGEVEVAKTAEEGVARIDVDPQLNV